MGLSKKRLQLRSTPTVWKVVTTDMVGFTNETDLCPNGVFYLEKNFFP